MESWPRVIIDSLIRPRVGIRSVLAAGFSWRILIEAAIVTACLSMVLGYSALHLSPATVDDMTKSIMQKPFLGMASQLVIVAFATGVVHQLGRMMGGTGAPIGALTVVVWLMVMTTIIQAVQILALLTLPPLASLMTYATMVWLIWAFAGFIGELHGFENTLVVVGAIFLAITVIFLGLAMVQALLGVSPQGIG